MKKYLLLSVMVLIVSAVKAQVQDPYMDAVYNNVFDPRNTIAPGVVEGVPMDYTDNGTSGEVTYTDNTGTTVDFSWSISSGTIYWNVDVEAPSSDVLGLHRLYITDDDQLTSEPETIVDDDFEDPYATGWGSSSWTSSGSASLGSAQRELLFSFENVADNYEDIGSNFNYEHFYGTIHYNDPL